MSQAGEYRSRDVNSPVPNRGGPRFSIITISYNHAEFIEDTIRSVQQQAFPGVQHIVIDGGSTDGTQAILARYPHLEWISEKDRGISHALNKGFALAKGEILAWLNADDWYAPGCLAAVSNAVSDAESGAAKRHAIVMGDAVETDRAKNPVRTIKNIPRGYFDAARYWVPNAWFAQPSVFFTRDLLENSKLPNGDYFDESFRYSMDADLWLRLGEHAPFDGYIPQVLSYFRVYGENKTGRTFAAPRKELGRAFRRATARIGLTERSVALVLPINQITTDLTATMATLLDQSAKDFELFIVDYSGDPAIGKSIREMVLEMEEHTLFGIKYLQADKPTVLSAWNAGLGASRGTVTGFFPTGTKFPAETVLNVQNVFLHDLYGAALALNTFPSEQARIVDLKTGNLNTVELLASQDSFGVVFCRTAALRELGGFLEQRLVECSVKQTLLSLLVKGWGLSIVNPIGIDPTSRKREVLLTSGVREALSPYEQSVLVVDSIREAAADIFYPVRAASGLVKGFSELDGKRALEFLEAAPPDFLNLKWLEDPAAATKAFPRFAPAWKALQERLTAIGNAAEASAAANNFNSLVLNSLGNSLGGGR